MHSRNSVAVSMHDISTIQTLYSIALFVAFRQNSLPLLHLRDASRLFRRVVRLLLLHIVDRRIVGHVAAPFMEALLYLASMHSAEAISHRVRQLAVPDVGRRLAREIVAHPQVLAVQFGVFVISPSSAPYVHRLAAALELLVFLPRQFLILVQFPVKLFERLVFAFVPRRALHRNAQCVVFVLVIANDARREVS